VVAFLVGLLVLIVAEIVVIIEAVHVIGGLATLVLLLAVPFVGVRLVRRQGLEALRRIQAAVATGQLPGPPIVDGGLILVAGLCLVVPGFITDAIGLLLLVPPVRSVGRAAVRWALWRRIVARRLR
jgi:UPF0716 protein FxsA